MTPIQKDTINGFILGSKIQKNTTESNLILLISSKINLCFHMELSLWSFPKRHTIEKVPLG